MNLIDIYDVFINDVHEMLSGLDLNLLTSLHALLRHRSVTAAAVEVGRTQSAMSHSLSRLRAHFKDQLLIREGWTMVPTPLALQLQPQIEDAVRAAEAVFFGGTTFNPLTSERRIRVAAPDLCAPMFSRLLSDIRNQAPSMTMEFVTVPAAHRAVLHSEADIGLAFGTVDVDPTLSARRLAPINWCTFARAGHPFAKEPTLAVWAGQPHVIVKTADQGKGPIEKILESRGVTRHVLAHAPNFLTALVLAEQANGLFTTLQQPYETVAHSLGLVAFAPPFDLPTVTPTLIIRPDTGDGFGTWLGRLCRAALP